MPANSGTGNSLEHYSRLLPMVEANTTFYGIPSEATVARWREQTPPSFRFCLKFPRSISHDKQLVDCGVELDEWLSRLTELGEQGGPSFLQLPPDFGPWRFQDLSNFLALIPRSVAVSVEARHIGWFQKPVEDDLNALLTELGVGRILYDVRPLRAAAGRDALTDAALAKKPRSPVRVVATSSHVHIRYIAFPGIDENDQWLSQWAPKVADMVREGRDVYFCMHSIFDEHMPRLCRRFHDMMATRIPLEPLPSSAELIDNGQMSLF